MVKVLYIIFLLAICCRASAQHIYEKLNLDIALGGEGYINNWESGEVTDALINPTDFSFTGKVRINYFFHRHWGIHGDFTIATYKTTGNKKKNIPERIADQFTNDFYIEDPHVITDRTHIYMRMMVGIQHRNEIKRWTFIPRISFGLAHIPADNCKFIIKGMDNNDQYQMEYYVGGNQDAEYGIVPRLFLNPAFQIGYKLKECHLTMEI